MTAHHNSQRILLGAYVLGGLSEPERWKVDEHLPTCHECREELSRSAPLAGLLRRAPGMELCLLPLADSEAAGALPPAVSTIRTPVKQLLDRVGALRAARRRRLRRNLLILTAALTVVAGLGIGLLVSGGASGPTRAFTAAQGYAVSGKATLTSKTWGTAVNLKFSDLPPQGPFVLQITSMDGRKEQAAAWANPLMATATVTGASSVDLHDIRSLTVLDRDGHMIARTSPPT